MSSMCVKFYGKTAAEAEIKAAKFAEKMDFMRQPRVIKAKPAPASITYMPDGEVIRKIPEDNYVAEVEYWGLD